MFSNLISAGLNTTTVSRSLRIEEELAEELVAASTNSSLISIYLYTSFQIQNSDIDCLFAIGDPRLYRVFRNILHLLPPSHAPFLYRSVTDVGILHLQVY